ncbi:MAG: hypothetical protein E7319_10285 [Clostridiales bacterium]|nr:hypothetical protein [Clostridiales bacterium]
MLIDFHTHLFPDAVAPKALASLKAGVLRQEGLEAQAYTDGTRSGLERSMEENGVDLSVVLPIATKPSQTPSINRFAGTVQSEQMLSFYSLHPAQEDWEAVLEDIVRQGGLGIKLHPEFQYAYIDSPEMVRILKKATELGLLVVLHTGADIGMPPPVHCTPQRLAGVLDQLDGSKIVAAHLGGFRMWDEVERWLVGRELYLDTAYVADFISREQYLRIIRAHGSQKILFGSDSPWERPQDTLRGLEALGLTPEEMNDITSGNALRLLGMAE